MTEAFITGIVFGILICVVIWVVWMMLGEDW